MTLCTCWVRTLPSLGEQLIMGTDSRITGGFDYDHGTKLSVFNRRDCAICWHGDTTFPYSFIANARNDIDFSDALSTKATGIRAVARRVLDVFNHLWDANLADTKSCYKNVRFDFMFGGYDYQLGECAAWLLEQDPNNSLRFVQREIPKSDLRAGVFMGSARQAASARLAATPQSPYAILRDICADTTIRDVGGYPQLAAMDRRGTEAIGVVDGGRRYLFGKQVNSSGHWTQARYVELTAPDV